MLSREEITRYLEEINDRLKEKNVHGEIVLAGGAALTLVFDAREATHDIDAIFTPANEFRDIIKDIAKKYSLEQDWLNDGVKGFLTKDLETDVYKKYSNLTIHSINAEGLLALKLTSARPVSKDLEDSITLMKYLNIKDSQQLLDIIEKCTHENQRTAQSYFFTLEAFEKYSNEIKRGILEDRDVPVKEPAPETSISDNATDKKGELYNLIKTTAETYEASPDSLSELFEFGSRFYNYSLRNNILIHHQNPNATYVQSFKAWKDMEGADCSVMRGEKGIKVLVPVKCTYLKVGDEFAPLREATKEQAAAHKRGEIESVEKFRFKVGTVFDISQTTFPKERYPELYSMGYPSDRHNDIIKGLTDFSKEKLNCPVVAEDLKSISLRGTYNPANNVIRLNTRLEDTEKLSTLSHELGHALIHKTLTPEKSTAQIEFEADAVSIMLQTHCGIPVTDSRKRHLSDNYNTLLQELKANPETEKKALAQTQQIFSSVFDTYKQNIEDIQRCIQQHIPEGPDLARKQAQAVKLNM